jgi:hypothetical protein
MAQKNSKKCPSSSEVFGTWSRTCPDAVRILKQAKTGELNAQGDLGKEVEKYINRYPGQISYNPNETGWPVKNFKRNIRALLVAYAKWELTGKGKKKQSKGTNCLFFES